MSYQDRHSRSGDSRDRYSRDSRRQSSSRSSPSRHHRSRHSPSPGPSGSRGNSPPRDPKTLPQSFGRLQESSRLDDDLNILQRMRTAYKNSPLASLYECIKDKRKVKIWTRNYKEVRGVMTGYVVAFDKHWNLILRDVDEVYLKPKKSKTPFLREVTPSETLPEMPVKVPKEKKAIKVENVSPEPPKITEESGEKAEKKKKKHRRKIKTTSEKRHLDQLFVRGDNVVMICTVLDDIVSEEIEEEIVELSSG